MSDDEIVVLSINLVIAVSGWYRWYATLINFKPLNSKRPGLFGLYFAPVAALGMIFYILRTLASFDVRDSVMVWGHNCPQRWGFQRG